jgi:CheY-like chemotaxis protein
MTKPSPSLRVLVVDDDPVLTDLLPSLLHVLGHRVHTANTGELALQNLATAPPLDAVLIDLRMPGMDGAELASAIAALPHPPRLIGMSGGEPTAAQSIHFSAFLQKPFGIDGLVRVLSDSVLESVPAPAAPPAAPMIDTPVLELAIYQRLAASMPNAQLLELYQRTLNQIRQTAPMFDTASETLRSELAHSLRGSCSMVGAMELAAVAASIEEALPTVQNSSPGTPMNSPLSYKILRASERLERMLKVL